ncbi:PH domain-containing protein [Nocardioides sp.]|uniref:PH domain-containing protein n=1 Tax=Nocardioides sp. TaxID=35761 RepID=UPI003518BD4F
MPAASEPAAQVPALPVTWRPLGPRIVGVVLGVGLLVVFGAAWLSFDEETQDSFTGLQIFTVLAVAALGFACLNALIRSRVVATREALVVVNGYKRRVLAWEQVVGVHLPPGAPWVTLDLADGSTCSAMGIQGSDGGRSAAAARQLRALVNQPPR